MAVPLRHVDATTEPLGDAVPKPTSRTGQREATAHVHGQDGDLEVGIWACEPGEFTADRSRATEVCQILSGSATVVGDDGTKAELSAGSLLVLPTGWRGTWTVHEAIRKTYVMLSEPARTRSV